MSTSAPSPLSALGICLEEYEYPYPVRFLPLTSDLQPVTMAYGDIPPSADPNGKTALLDHLGVERVAVLGHSTGGMTAARFTLMNPDRVTHPAPRTARPIPRRTAAVPGPLTRHRRSP